MQLAPYVDPTGELSLEEINSKNIAAIIQEYNKTNDTLSNQQQLSLFTDGATNRYLSGYQTNGWGIGKNVGIKVSKPGVEVTTATDNQLVYKDDFTTKTYYDETGTPRILEGLLPDGTYGVWQSIPGIDVRVATSQQLIFNSNQRVFIVVKTGKATIPGAGPQAASASGAFGTQVAHNLGYPPAFLAFSLAPVVSIGGFPPVSQWNQMLPIGAYDGHTNYNLRVGTDSTNIYFTNAWFVDFANPAPGIQSFDITYYLYNVSAQ